MESSLDWFTKAVMVLISVAVIGAFVQLFIKASKKQNLNNSKKGE